MSCGLALPLSLCVKAVGTQLLRGKYYVCRNWAPHVLTACAGFVSAPVLIESRFAGSPERLLARRSTLTSRKFFRSYTRVTSILSEQAEPAEKKEQAMFTDSTHLLAANPSNVRILCSQ